MNPSIFIEWWKRQGNKIFQTESSFWIDHGLKAVQAFPYHWIITPNEKELLSVFRQSRAIILRYSSPLRSPEGKISYHAVYESKNYDFDILGKWARKNVRHGLKNCEVENISFERLAEEGYELQIDTLSRQGRNLKISKEEWKNRCFAAIDLPGFDGWGAIVDGRLAASVITFQMDNWGYMLYQQCDREYLNKHVNNALGFTVTKQLLARKEINSILYGLHSLDAPSRVDEFKFRMGYIAKPVRQRVVVSPKVAPFVNDFTHAGINTVKKVLPGNSFFAKTEGMVRFYIEGKYPLEKQEWPEILGEQKEAILSSASE